MSVPAGLFLEPAPEWDEHLIGLASAITGLAAIFAPWERMSNNWLHAGMVVATVEIAIGVGVLSDDYAFYYVLVAIYAAYVVRDGSVLIAYLSFLALVLLAPLAYDDGDAREQAHHILVTLPVLLIAAATVRYLRDTLERRESEFRTFAHEAVELAERIRGPSPDGDRLDELARELDREG